MLRNNLRGGFTLIEMAIAMLILSVFMTTISYYFTYMTTSFTTSQYINKSYEKFQDFKFMYLQKKADEPISIVNTGGISQGDPYGYELLAFANSGQTMGFIVGAYDLKNLKIVTGKVPYSDIVLFTYDLDGTGITNMMGNTSSFMNSMVSSSMRMYKDVKLLKLGYNTLNSSNAGKLDVVITPEYNMQFKGLPVQQVMDQNKMFMVFNISIVK